MSETKSSTAKNLTLYISAELAEKMEKLPEINWSQVAREAIQRYIDERLNSALPLEIVARLRKEMGDEFTSGKLLVTEKLVPIVSYRTLEAFFTKARDMEIKACEQDAKELGVDYADVNFDLENSAVKIIKDYFPQIPRDASIRYCKGVFKVLNEVWEAIQK
jgi:hypothetical protein